MQPATSKTRRLLSIRPGLVLGGLVVAIGSSVGAVDGAAAAQETETSDVAQGAPDLAPDRPTTLAALQLVNDAVTVQADGSHNRLLRALRHLEDPTLRPLFTGLSLADHPSLQVHGILGVAELDRPRGLKTPAIAALDRPDVQAELVSAALDGELIAPETRSALLGWPGLDAGVKLLLAAPRVAAGEFGADSPGHDALLSALEGENPGRRGLAALLLTQLDDERGRRALDALTGETHPTADAVRATLLETAWAHGMVGVAPWAFDVASSADVPPRLEMLALKVAIRFGDARADAHWASRWAEDDDLSMQARLAWVGLEAAPWLDPARFDPLVSHSDPLIAQLGRTAHAVAHSRKAPEALHDAETEVLRLIEMGHPQASGWAAGYAEDVGSAPLTAGVIMNTEPGEPRGRARRLNAVVRSVQTLIDIDPETAERLLTTALQTEDADEAWRRGVLLGLIRSRSDTARRIVRALPDFDDRDTQALALVLRLQRPGPLTEEQAEDLSLLIRGGAELDDSLRVQTAWSYLQRTGQGTEAIAAVLAEP